MHSKKQQEISDETCPPSNINRAGKKQGQNKRARRLKREHLGHISSWTGLPLDLSFNSRVWDVAKIGTNSQGYRFRYVWDPVSRKLYTKLEHILVWERVHQRVVSDGCCIHHRDCNRLNNRAENLLCMPIIFHLHLHSSLRKAKANFSGLALEVERQRIIADFVDKAEFYEEIWGLVYAELTEMGYQR
jgi:hypothetical protein